MGFVLYPPFVSILVSRSRGASLFATGSPQRCSVAAADITRLLVQAVGDSKSSFIPVIGAGLAINRTEP